MKVVALKTIQRGFEPLRDADGKVVSKRSETYRPGTVVDLPDEMAENWLRRGIAALPNSRLAEAVIARHEEESGPVVVNARADRSEPQGRVR